MLLQYVILAVLSEISTGTYHVPTNAAGSNVLSTEVTSSASLLRRERVEPAPEKADSWQAPVTTNDNPGPCIAEICGPGKVLRPIGQSPTECRYTGHCQQEECCLGFCAGFACPADSAPMGAESMPQACEGYECDAAQCCVGTCKADACPAFSFAKSPDAMPERCNSHPCEPAECCLGTCAGTQCPAGSIRKNDTVRPSVCRTFPM